MAAKILLQDTKAPRSFHYVALTFSVEVVPVTPPHLPGRLLLGVFVLSPVCCVLPRHTPKCCETLKVTRRRYYLL